MDFFWKKVKQLAFIVVYIMVSNVMILMRASPQQEPLEGVGPENRDFLG
jgi:hypothetical protein